MEASGATCCTEVAPRHFAEWQRSIARSFVPMQASLRQAASRERFRGTIARSMLGPVSVSLVRADAHSATRSAAFARRHPAEYMKFSCMLASSSTVEQDGRVATIAPGDFVAYDTERAYGLHFDDHSHSVVVQVPAEVLGDDARRAIPTATVLPATDFLPGFAAFVGTIAAADDGLRRDSSALGLHLLQLLMAGAVPAAAVADPGFSRFDAITRFLEANLSEDALALEDVARAVYVSPRQIQRHFHERGTTFVAWMRERRLARARDRIVDTGQPIADIAAECGFASPSHFSRAFRERFGVAPRIMRAQARAATTR